MSARLSTNGKPVGGNGREFDAIIIGSGPGGATVARELTKRGRRVMMLEWAARLR